MKRYQVYVLVCVEFDYDDATGELSEAKSARVDDGGPYDDLGRVYDTVDEDWVADAEGKLLEAADNLVSQALDTQDFEER